MILEKSNGEMELEALKKEAKRHIPEHTETDYRETDYRSEIEHLVKSIGEAICPINRPSKAQCELR